MASLSRTFLPWRIALLVTLVHGSSRADEGTGAKIGGMRAETAKTWWAFQPIRPPAVPDATATSGHGNEIDRFVQARLDGAGLVPAPAADRRTLIRRATYDLTGLPPTPGEVESFLADRAPDAFAQVVERLLASPHYGERWGRHWLDVVRYADTAGENTDRPLPHIWRYRNWVFDAFNRDLPFDAFTRLQIAGDLPSAGATGAERAEGIVATGYLALARRFGHDSDKDIHLMHEDVIDNLGKAFLGLTLACARCHDHKYDPVTAEDYYALYGILASTRFSFAGCEAKGAPRDLVDVLAPAEIEALKAPWRERMARSEGELNKIAARLRQAGEALEAMAADATRVLAVSEVGEGATVGFGEGEALGFGAIAVRRGEILRLVVSPQGSHGADSTRVEWEIAEVGGDGRRWSVGDLIPDFLAGNPHTATDGGAQWCFLDLKDGTAFLGEKTDRLEGKDALKAWRSGDTPSVFVNTSPEPVPVWTTLPARAFFVHPGPEGPVAVSWTSPCDGEVAVTGRVSDVHPGGSDGVAFRLEHIAAPDYGPALAALGETARGQAEIVRKRDAEAGTEPATPVAFAVAEAEPVNSRLHERGDPAQPGGEVPRRWLSVFGGELVPADAGSGRRELAEWIVRHPLGTRVVVNRVWQGHFGTGLVRTPNDFGARGEAPTHPELLEWLGARFEENGRSLKALHRLIMASAAYQRASGASSEEAARDPENRLLARFDRRRLSAEELRDSLLAVGGNLDPAPAEAHPFPPESTWTFTQHAPFNAVYDNSKRSAYQMVQRQRRHPFLALFDGADPNAATAGRQTTTAPTQALFFLNDPFFHAQAAHLAASLADAPDDGARLARAFRAAYQREPDDGERALATRLLADYPGTAEEKWSALARLLLAGNEFVHLD